MGNEPIPSGWMTSPDGPLADLFAEMHYLDASENPFPFPVVLQFDTMIIEPNRYLPAVMDDFHLAGGRIVVQEFHTVAELQAIPERVIVNCTGLGAKTLFGDEELTPIKGQITVLLPQPEIDYCTIPPDLYMFPRSDGILLGGTHERGVWSLGPDLQAKQRILSEHARIFQSMR
jgi:D-amino-acid oxidase